MVAEACEGVHVVCSLVHDVEVRFTIYPASSQPCGLLSGGFSSIRPPGMPRQANLERTEVRGSDDGIMAGMRWDFLRLILYVFFLAGRW